MPGGIPFPNFERELKEHPAPGYHDFGRVDREVAVDWFAQRNIKLLPAYLDFLSTFGTGWFFSGSLVIFSVKPKDNLDSQTDRLPEAVRLHLYVIGYDGTTEGCYCLDRSGMDPAVYWHNWSTREAALHEDDFSRWIEAAPGECFNKTVYAGYKAIRDPTAISHIINERSAFEVRLIEFGRELVRPPGKEKDILARYHRLVFGVRKLRETELSKLTVKLHRTGSKFGGDNVEYVTLDVSRVPVGSEARVEAFAFDPFNTPFKEIVSQYTPNIDLGSKMRVRFAEIKDHL